MKNHVGLIVSGIGVLCYLFFFCATPQNPYENTDNIKVTFEFPAGHSSGTWDIDSSVEFDASVLLIEKVDSAIVSWGDATYDTMQITAAQISSGKIPIPPHQYASAGSITITITTFADGKTKEFPVEITITCSGPDISATYQTATATEGAAYSISVKVDGSIPAFQWYKNDTAMLSQTNDSLKFSHLAQSDSGFYYCIAKNPCGEDTSEYDTITFTGGTTLLSVTYNGNGNTSGIVPVDANAYEQGDLVTVKGNTGNMARAGYAFVGWNTIISGTGTSYAGSETFNIGGVDVILYAQWTQNPTYTVTYNGNGNTSGSVPTDANDYEQGSSVTVKGNSGNLVRTGYAFVGWNTVAAGTGTSYAGSEAFNIGGADVTLYAQWTQNPTYIVTYNGSGNISGTVPVDANSYEEGANVTVKGNTGNLAKTGYTFAGWSTGDSSGTIYAALATFAMGDSNVILYANWTQNPTYTVTYNGNGSTSGSVPTDANAYEQGASVTVKGNTSNLVRTSYSFVGWNTVAAGTGTSYAGSETFNIGGANVTLYAQWTQNPTYTVTYSGNGSTGGSVPTDANAYEQGASVTVKGNTGNLVRTAYSFVGWNTVAAGTGTSYAGSETFNIGGANVTLYAQWTQNPTYTVTYNGNGNTSGSVPVDANSYEQSASVTVKGNTGNLAKTGFTFAGWNSTANGNGTSYAVLSSFTMGDSNVILYANWTQNPTYTVTYNGNGSTGGSVPTDANAYEQGASVTVKGNTGNLVRTGYTFVGWNTVAAGTGTSYAGSDAFNIGAANVTLFAQWTQNPTYTVTYNGAGNTSGSVPIDVNSYEQGASVTAKGNTGNLARTGYTFAGWNTGDGSGTIYAALSSFTMGNANVVLYANWTQNPTYTVTYNGNGSTSGSVPADANAYEQNASVTVRGNTGNLARTGYTFVGWNTLANGNGTAYAATATFSMGTTNVTLYAQWTLIPTYTMTYNGNGSTGGSVPTDANTYVQDATVTVKGNTGSLVRTGYIFAGWNTAADGTGISRATGETFSMPAANVTLYAKWTPVYSVTYSGNGSTGGTAPSDNATYQQGATVTVLGNTGALVRTGYTFASWNTASDGSGVNRSSGESFLMGSANVTLYAKWTPVYTVTYNGNHNTSGSAPLDGTAYTNGQTVTIANAGTLARTGHTFLCWNTDSLRNGTDRIPGNSFTMGSASVTLYAQWTPLPDPAIIDTSRMHDTTVNMRTSITLRGHATYLYPATSSTVKWEWKLGTNGNWQQTADSTITFTTDSTDWPAYPCSLRVTNNHGEITAKQKRLTIGKWVALGSTGLPTDAAIYENLVFCGSVPYLSFGWGSSTPSNSVMKYDGTNNTWSYVGSQSRATYLDAQAPVLASYNGFPYLAYSDGAAGRAIKWDGSAWVDIATLPSSPPVYQCHYFSMTVAGGTPYLAYGDGVYGQKLTVLSPSGGVWSYVGGSAGISFDAVQYTSIAVYNGTPYVAFQDASSSNAAVVWSYTGAWGQVGNFASSGTASYISLAFNSSTPYVAFQDGANSNKATLMRLNGSLWTSIGPVGFSAGQADYISLAIIGGVPHVAFKDGANGGKVSIMKYGPTGWAVVGSATLPAGAVNWVSLAAYNNAPAVAFQDMTNGGKATVLQLR